MPAECFAHTPVRGGGGPEACLWTRGGGNNT